MRKNVRNVCAETKNTQNTVRSNKWHAEPRPDSVKRSQSSPSPLLSYVSQQYGSLLEQDLLQEQILRCLKGQSNPSWHDSGGLRARP